MISDDGTEKIVLSTAMLMGRLSFARTEQNVEEANEYLLMFSIMNLMRENKVEYPLQKLPIAATAQVIWLCACVSAADRK